MLYTLMAMALVGVLALVLACGGTDEPEEEAAPTTAPAAAAQPTAVPATAAPAEVTATEHIRMAQGAEPNSMYSP